MSIVRLGDFIFTKSELPDFIPFGGTQALAVHQLVGGQKSVDAMGMLEPDIYWEGIIIGNEMYQKARYLDSLLRDAKPLVLSYDQFRYNVLIQEFKPRFRKTYVEYSILLQVIENLTKPVLFAPQITWAEAFQQQLLEAQELADLIKNGDISDKVSAIGDAFNQIPDLGIAGQSDISNLLGLTGDASSAVSGVINSTSNGLFG